MAKMKRTVLEPSSNTHTLVSHDVKVTDLGNSTLKLKIKGDGVLVHGEHGTIKTESPDVMKYVQQEFNPVTRAMQNAYD